MSQEDPEEQLRARIRQDLGTSDPTEPAQRISRSHAKRLIVFVVLIFAVFMLLNYGFSGGTALFE